MYKRNNRDRNNNDNIYKDINVAMDLLDSIHCYFIHSVDQGIRCFKSDHDNKENEEVQERKTNENDEYFDSEISILRNRLSKRKGIIGLNRIKQNKFITQIITNNQDEKDNMDQKMEEKNDKNDKETKVNNYNFLLTIMTIEFQSSIVSSFFSARLFIVNMEMGKVCLPFQSAN